MFINILNTSQNNKEVAADARTLNEVEKDFVGHSILQGCTQTSDFIFNTQEKFNSNLLEKINNSNDYNNHNSSASPVDELGNQNCISLEALKGKMSQDITFDSEFKNKSKNNLDLNWQEGKVSIKKGKIKVECNYAFTPTKSSLRVRCIYCKKIYFSVKGFISHRGRCIYYKTFQNTQYESISQNYKNNNSNKYSLNGKEKSFQNNNQQILNSLVNTQHTDNSQYNAKINSSSQFVTNEDAILFNYNIDSRFHFEEREMDNLSTHNLLKKVTNGNIQIFESDKSANLNSNKFQPNKKLNGKIENISFCNNKINVENFKMHLYAAISCLPRYLVTKVLKKINPDISIAINEESEENITKEELIDMIFVGIGQRVVEKNAELKNGANEKLLEQNKNLLNNLRSNKKDKIEFEIDSIKSESNTINSNRIKDENFQLNIPVFFRHSLPKDSEWKCFICKAPRNGKESMNMCVNCGYVYHFTCQSQANKITKNDWFCDYCKTHGNKLKPGSKFQIGELVWVNYKGTVWPAQIMDFSKEQFEVLIFHIEKRIEKSSSEMLSWSKGITSIDGFASKGTFVRESASSVMHWQSVYKAIKYYLNSLRSKQRRLPQINKKKNSPLGFKMDDAKKKKIDNITLSDSNSETQVFHPIPSGINDGLEENSNEISFLNICPQINIQNNS